MTKHLINDFNILKQECERRLLSVPVTSEDFPNICQDILSASSFRPELKDLSLPDFWNAKYQHFKNNEFSQFPLTLHSWDDFFLDLYFWAECRTSIHDHHFHGAFKVIEGDYCETSFTFKEGFEISADIFKGTLLRGGHEEIAPGRTKKISMNEPYIHCVSHTQKINITLCLRSRDLTPYLNEYLFPGYKITLRPIEINIRKRLDFAWNLVINLRQDCLLPKGIQIVDILKYSNEKIKDSEQFDLWWNLVSKTYGETMTSELRMAQKKTKLFPN